MVLLVKINIILLSGIVAYLLYRKFCARELANEFLAYRAEKNMQLKNHMRYRLSYEESYMFLLSQGFIYQTGGHVMPFEYWGIRITCMVIGVLLGILIEKVIFIPILAIMGFFILPLYIREQNKNSNERILRDLGDVYTTLSMHANSGVHLSKALYECYLSVPDSNRRLKTALYELTTQISTTQNMEQAIEEFNLKFSNQYIDSLCECMMQSLVTGKAAQMFEDIAKQMSIIDEAVNMAEERRMDNIISGIGTLAFVLGVGAIFYVSMLVM